MNISIIIPTFKRQASLRRLITSILKQNYPLDKFEVIVVDDQSGEDLSGLINDFCNQNLLCFWIRSKTKGRPGARNTGAEKAKGKILIIFS